MLVRIALGLVGIYFIARCKKLGPKWIQARMNSTGQYMPPISWKVSPMIPVIFGIVFIIIAIFEKRLSNFP